MIQAKRIIFHSLFLGAIFGLFGYFLVDYGLLSPLDNSPPTGNIEIQATGGKDKNSKSTEVWLYGAFRVSDDKKIPWGQFAIDSSWEKRDEIYVSYKTQPTTVILKYEEPFRLEFGSSAYSGVVNIKWKGGAENINLYSKNSGVKSVFIDKTPNYKNSKYYSYILLCFVFCGFLLSAVFVYTRWKGVYRWVFALFLLFSFYLTLSVYFPGVYTNDSADQLRQALTDHYDDWHPPLMAWFWSVLIKTTGRIESLMICHLLFMMVGAIYWAKIFERLKMGYLSLIIPVLFLSPIVINFSGVVWKDVGFASALFLTCGIVGVALIDKYISLRCSLVVVGLLTYAFGVRLNGVFAVFPITLFLVWTIFSTRIQKFSNFSKFATFAFSVIISFSMLVALLVCVYVFSYHYIKSEKRYPIQYLELYDIAGISHISGRDYFPNFITSSPGHNFQKISQEYIESVSVQGNANNLLFRGQDGSASLIPLNKDDELQKQLRASWLMAMLQEPRAYLKHRLSVMNFLMAKGMYYFQKPQSDSDRKSVLEINSVELKEIKLLEFDFLGEAGAKYFFSNSMTAAQGSLLYNGWFWLVLLVFELFVGLVMMRRSRSGFIMVMVSASGLLYIFPYFIVAPASDFRYLYWSSISGSILAIFIISLAIDMVLRRSRFLAMGHQLDMS